MPLDAVSVEIVEDGEAGLERETKIEILSQTERSQLTSGCGGFSPAALLSG